MAKRQTFSNEDLADAARKADDLYFDLAALVDMIRKGGVGEIADATNNARNFCNLARIASDLAGAILTSVAMQQDRDALRKELEARVANGE